MLADGYVLTAETPALEDRAPAAIEAVARSSS